VYSTFELFKIKKEPKIPQGTLLFKFSVMATNSVASKETEEVIKVKVAGTMTYLVQ
jgi:hypothetical protein